ncbi:MAG: hypothetical protein OEQ39_05685 [Gammaproteobacteria bacterium]|nr:hypothetical protein [Gammaproteobacteria bacterium]
MKPRDFRDIIDLWARPTDMANQLCVQRQVVTDWKTRNRIPTKYWLTIIDAVAKMGHEISAHDLLLIELRSAPHDLDPAHRLQRADREHDL